MSKEAALIEKNAGFIVTDLRRLLDALRELEESVEGSPLKGTAFDGGPGSPSTTSDPTAAAALGLRRQQAYRARADAWSEVRKAAQLLTAARGRLERAT